MEKEIRVLIVDDHPLMRDGLSTMLRQIPQVLEVGRAENGQEAVQMALKFQPNVVLMDIKMPEMNGVQAAREILKHRENVGIIAISMYDDEETVTEMFYTGIRGYLLKSTTGQELRDAILAVASGEEYFCPEASNVLLRRLSRKNKNIRRELENGLFNLRELEIIRMICNQKTSREIADIICLSERTVESLRLRIMQKMGVRNVAGIVVYALKRGLIDLGEVEL